LHVVLQFQFHHYLCFAGHNSPSASGARLLLGMQLALLHD
jgi:hypothetical protein